MTKTYIIISVSDYKDSTMSSRTVHCGEVPAQTSGTIAVTPMITYTFALTNPSSQELTDYDVNKYVTLTVAPSAEPKAS